MERMGAARTTMKMIATALLVAGLSLTAAACGGKDESATTTTAKPGTTTPQTLATTTTLDNAGYEAFAKKMKGQISAAGNDQCKLEPLFMELSSGDGTAPANPEQVKLAVGLTVQLFNAVAASAGPSRAKEAADIKSGSAEVAAAAEKNGYSLEWIRSPESSTSFGPTFVQSLGAIRTDILKNCKKN